MYRIVNPYVPYTYENLLQEAFALARAYPEWISLFSAGRSVLGRSLLCLRFGSGRPVFLVGAHHAREYLSSAFLMAMAERYASLCECRARYEGIPLCELFRRVSLVFLPMVNPDGVELCIQGAEAGGPTLEGIKQLDPAGFAAWKANINGVDLNRNYPCLFEKKGVVSPVPASEGFNGAHAASEPEVRAVMRLCETERFCCAATFHTKGEEILYGDANTPAVSSASLPLARALSRLTGYSLCPPSKDPALFAAGFENWFRASFCRPCFLFELTPMTGGSIPHDPQNFDAFFSDALYFIGVFLARCI